MYSNIEELRYLEALTLKYCPAGRISIIVPVVKIFEGGIRLINSSSSQDVR